jgi:hypothetical protein
MHTVQRNLACINRAPLQALPRQLQGASSTAATTPRPPARHALEDLHDQDSVVGSGGFDSDSDGFGY